MMRIIVDVDCTVADYVGRVLELQEECTGVRIDRKDITLPFDWYNDSPEKVRNHISATMDTLEFWRTLPLIENAKEGIEYLRSQKHDLVWVSKPRESCVGWADARRDWLKANFNIHEYNEPYVPTGDKWLIQATCIIDDYLPYVEAWQKHNRNGIGFVFASELNKGYQGDRYTWKDIMSMSFFKRKDR